jgi:hypothetical protein
MNISTCEQCVNGRLYFFSLQLNRLFRQSASISSMNKYICFFLKFEAHIYILYLHLFLMLYCCTIDADCRRLLFFLLLFFCFSLCVQSQLRITTTHYSSFVFLLSFLLFKRSHSSCQK